MWTHSPALGKNLTSCPTLSCLRKAVAQSLESTVADREKQQPGYLHSALCSAVSQKSSRSVCTGWFKPIVAHSESWYKVICPLCTPLSLLLSAAQWLLAGLLSLKRQNRLFQMYSRKGSQLFHCDPGALLPAAG